MLIQINCRVKIASSAVHATLSSDSEDSSDDDDDDDVAFMTTAHTHDSSENKEDSQELWRTVPAMKSKACFNFDLSTRQKTIMQRTKEKDKEKAKKTRGGVRFRSEGEFPPIFSPTENIMPYDDTQQQCATWPTEGQLSSDTSKINTGNGNGTENAASSGNKSEITGKPRRSLLENNSILEVVSAAIEMLFSSSRQTTPATSVSPSPSSTPSPYLSSSLPNHLQHSTYKQRSHFF